MCPGRHDRAAESSIVSTAFSYGEPDSDHLRRPMSKDSGKTGRGKDRRIVTAASALLLVVAAAIFVESIGDEPASTTTTIAVPGGGGGGGNTGN
ncbi:Uncharacterised protein [Amycolatopsis camponoti]|uniref:Uncharacterized protein n=2 Tax=Amycolatopsis camponoti TaxID=2606593 RepID=A0A6I8LNQ0_9PSEU|nr:Uncharacterised protein [Amycolatopsis camponoti]